MSRRLHWAIKPNKISGDGRRSWGLGVRLGYWPCTRGPYMQVEIAFWHLSIWWGYVDYAAAGEADFWRAMAIRDDHREGCISPQGDQGPHCNLCGTCTFDGQCICYAR